MLRYCFVLMIVLGNQDHYTFVSSEKISKSSLIRSDVINFPNNMKLTNIGENRFVLIREDYNYTLGVGAYKFHTQAQTWNDARKICNDEKAHLAIINSNVEKDVLSDIFKKNKNLILNADRPVYAFLGIHDMFEEGEWVTIFGDSLHSTGYSNWSKNNEGAVEPNNFENNENCGAMMYNGDLNDLPCSYKYAFFCEMLF